MENDRLLAEASAILAERRRADEREYGQRRADCFSACPRLAEIEREAALTGLEAARCALLGDASRSGEITAASLKLQSESADLLGKLGKPRDWLDMKYRCAKCRDTGLLGDRRCDCLEKLITELAAKHMNELSPLRLCSFEDFDLNYYSEETDERYGSSPRETMSDVFRFIKEYAADFGRDSKSVLLWGAPGLGKTHLALAAAAEIIKKGFYVVYIPAHTLCARLEKERFSRDEDGDSGETALGCDLLVLDDLGTEFLTPFIQTQLYDIINTRLLTSRPTVVSTNLNEAELRARYPERLVSRLTGSYEDLYFMGKDVRLIKKISKQED